MTRFARGGPSNRKKLPGATPWVDLHQQQDKSITKQDLSSGGPHKKNPHASHDKLHKTRKTIANNSTEKISNSGNKTDNISSSSPGGSIVKRNRMSSGSELPSQSSEFRRLRRQDQRKQSLVCFHCRKKGHSMAECPRGQTDVEHGVGICYKCGSTEHKLGRCRARVNPTKGELPFAKCYVCGQMGHLSKGCPDNPKGLYPEGGCCRDCGSVEHYRRDCPTMLNKDRTTSHEIVLDTISNNRNESAETDSLQIIRPPRENKKRAPKIVKF